MFAFNKEVFVFLVYLFVVSMCVNYVEPFVLNDQPDLLKKSTDLLHITSSDIDNVLEQNGLTSNELEEIDGRQLGGGGGGGGHHGGGGFGGGKKKGKHMRRILYPVLMGLFIAKIIIFPLLLKALTIMSSASFVLSKMSLLSTIMLGFKWFLTQNNMQQQTDSKVEVVHVPLRKYNTQHNEWDRDADNKYSMPIISENNENYYNDHDMNLKPTTYVK